MTWRRPLPLLLPSSHTCMHAQDAIHGSATLFYASPSGSGSSSAPSTHHLDTGRTSGRNPFIPILAFALAWQLCEISLSAGGTSLAHLRSFSVCSMAGVAISGSMVGGSQSQPAPKRASTIDHPLPATHHDRHNPTPIRQTAPGHLQQCPSHLLKRARETPTAPFLQAFFQGPQHALFLHGG